MEEKQMKEPETAAKEKQEDEEIVENISEESQESKSELA